MKKKILIIGAGAVGVVYGKHLSEGGHQITFLVKEKYLGQLSEGAVLYHMNKDKSLKEPIHFKDFDLISSFGEVGRTEWDQIYLCFSSTALQSYDFEGFKSVLVGEPTIVMLQPSSDDHKTLCKTFLPNQIVEGMITLISYATPLATEQVNVPGTAYWLPPMMPTPFSGEAKRRDEVISVFRDGKIKASISESVRDEALFPSSFLAGFLTALEYSDWNFVKMKKDGTLLKDLHKAVDEVFNGLEHKHGVKRPFPFRIISRPSIVRLLLRLAPRVMPMDIETYFEYHFTKVKDQTKLYMENYLDAAKEAGTAHDTLERFNAMT
ncbi:MAG: hypothetical protein GY751_00060 [Bacteroidetes bacterium]|nr:hypothetical protein [Bacteroidota bacterium]